MSIKLKYSKSMLIPKVKIIKKFLEQKLFIGLGDKVKTPENHITQLIKYTGLLPRGLTARQSSRNGMGLAQDFVNYIRRFIIDSTWAESKDLGLLANNLMLYSMKAMNKEDGIKTVELLIRQIERIEDDFCRSTFLNNIANFYFHFKDYSNSFLYSQQAQENLVNYLEIEGAVIRGYQLLQQVYCLTGLSLLLGEFSMSPLEQYELSRRSFLRSLDIIEVMGKSSYRQEYKQVSDLALKASHAYKKALKAKSIENECNCENLEENTSTSVFPTQSNDNTVMDAAINQNNKFISAANLERTENEKVQTGGTDQDIENSIEQMDMLRNEGISAMDGSAGERSDSDNQDIDEIELYTSKIELLELEMEDLKTQQIVARQLEQNNQAIIQLQKLVKDVSEQRMLYMGQAENHGYSNIVEEVDAYDNLEDHYSKEEVSPKFNNKIPSQGERPTANQISVTPASPIIEPSPFNLSRFPPTSKAFEGNRQSIIPSQMQPMMNPMGFQLQDTENEDSLFDDSREDKPKQKRWEMSLFNYRNKENPRLVPDNSIVVVREFELDLQQMLDDYKARIGNKRVVFKKPLVIAKNAYAIILKIWKERGELMFEIDPVIDNRSEVNDVEYHFKRENLNEIDFIKLINEISVVEKLLPIDSIYTIGSFNEIIEKFLMPSLIIQEDSEDQTINLEVWPFSIDILYNSKQFYKKKTATNWYHHMYDNHVRLFIHLRNTLEVEDGCFDMECVERGFHVDCPAALTGCKNPECRDEECQGGCSDSEFTSVPIDIAVSPLTFNDFFECKDEQDYSLRDSLLRIKEIKDLEDSASDNTDSEYESLQNNIFRMMMSKKKYGLRESEERFLSNSDIQLEDEEEHYTVNQMVLDKFIVHSINHVIDIYEKAQIDLFSKTYYMTYVSTRSWDHFRHFLVFMLYDDYEHERINIYSKVIHLDEDMNNEHEIQDNNIYIVSYEEIDRAFCSKLIYLEWENRKIFYKFLIDSFSVVDQNEVKIDMNYFDQNSNLTLIKIEQYNPESIMSVNFFARDQLDGYCHPFSISMLALNGVPLGFKVEKFIPELLDFDQVAFLIIHPHVWRKNQVIIPPDDKRLAERDEVDRLFYLFEFMEGGGIHRIISNVKQMVLKNGFIDSNPENYMLDTFENYLY